MKEIRNAPRKHRSDFWLGLLFAMLASVAFIGLLVFSVTWRNPPAKPVTAEIYAPPAPTPEPKVETPPPPPPPPPPKPEVVPPKPPQPDPQILIKQQKEKEAKEKKEREAKEKKAREEKAKKDKEAKEKKERAEREKKEREEREAAEREAQMQQMLAQQAFEEARQRWIDRIRAKIKGNINLPPNMEGNPEAVFNVIQLPTGEILSATLAKSSGNSTYDDAVYRAILKSSPLPKPERTDLFQRELRLNFRPSE